MTARLTEAQRTMLRHIAAGLGPWVELERRYGPGWPDRDDEPHALAGAHRTLASLLARELVKRARIGGAKTPDLAPAHEGTFGRWAYTATTLGLLLARPRPLRRRPMAALEAASAVRRVESKED